VRVKAFHEAIAAVEALYEDILIKIEGTGPKEDVWGRVQKVLKQ